MLKINFLGSISIIFNSSGLFLVINEAIIEAIQTDLPLCVEPATNPCGIDSRDVYIGFASISKPTAIKRGSSEFRKYALSITSPKIRFLLFY